MTKIYVVIFIACVSCSHLSKNTTITKLIESDRLHKIKIIPVSDSVNARKIMQDRLTYLNLLFEQFYQPYHPDIFKWYPHCMKDNQIGKIEKRGDMLFSVSRLYLDKQRVEGHCSDKIYALPGFSVDVYCAGQNSIRNYKFVTQESIKWEKVELCN